jgi:hypothetical protein
MTPQDLADLVRDWATGQGYTFSQEPHGSEFCKVGVQDPNGSHSGTTIPNPHHGRRLRKDQVRYVVRQINNRWS